MSDRFDPTADTPANDDAPGWPPKWAPPRLVALAEIHVLAREAVEWNAALLDDEEGDGYVSGADTLEFLCDWRERMREQLDRYEAACDERSPSGDRSVVKTLTIVSDDLDNEPDDQPDREPERDA